MASGLRKTYRITRQYCKDYYASRNRKVKLFNFLHYKNHQPGEWLFQFIIRRGILNDYRHKAIAIFSVHGEKTAIKLNRSEHKLFFTDENVHVPYSYWQKYEDLLVDNQSIDLSLGFDYLSHDKYLRFPLWIMNNFEPDADFQSIQHTCKYFNKHVIDISSRIKFCSFLSRTDFFGIKKTFYEQVSQVGHIDCDSTFLHNNNDLKEKYNDNKREYLKAYRFNLCPENSDADGYVTEKIFDAIYSGCIPVFWGSLNHPEPDVLNHKSILFIKDNNENDSLIKELRLLNENVSLYREFAGQDRLSKDADEIIYGYFRDLENKLKSILK